MMVGTFSPPMRGPWVTAEMCGACFQCNETGGDREHAARPNRAVSSRYPWRMAHSHDREQDVRRPAGPDGIRSGGSASARPAPRTTRME